MKRRNSSNSRFRLFKFTNESPTNIEDKKMFTQALISALNQAAKECDSAHFSSSIFTDNINQRQTWGKLNASEGVAGGRVNSPIRESILNSSRHGSQDK